MANTQSSTAPDASRQLPAFAIVSLGELKIFLSGPEASGSRPTGPGGRQIQIEDTDGNPIELFEPGS